MKIVVKKNQKADSSGMRMPDNLRQDSLDVPLKTAKKAVTQTYNLKEPPKSISLNNISLISRKKTLITPYWIIDKRKVKAGEKTDTGGRRDTIRGPRIIKQWNLSPDFSHEVPVPF
ncbi:MAG: hypothetical protein HZB98_11600, partial [Bacteroidia bacterium]|nr:hypothetical protein [Bacteroidia bacterium]